MAFQNLTEASLNICTVISSTGQSLDYTKLVLEFSYYEDLFDNCISGVLIVNDTMNYINMLQMDGNEQLFIDLDNAGRGKSLQRFFRIFSISNRETNNKSEVYALHFSSEELFLSKQLRIARAYNKTKISKMIETICLDELKIDEGKLNIEETTGLRDIIIPTYKPLEAINWLASQGLSHSDVGIGSPYVFFENQSGYNFVSIDNLLKQDTYRDFTYSAKNAGLKYEDEYKSAISYEHVSNFDTLLTSMTGTFANKLITFDPLRGKFGETNYNYNKAVEHFNLLNEDGFQAEDKNRLGLTQDTSSSVVRFVVSTTGQSENEYIKNKKVHINENLPENIKPYITSRLMLLQQNKMNILVYGDISLKVGQVINFYLPNQTAGNFGDPIDTYYSGRYLITALRHIFNIMNGFTTSLEICKDSSTSKRSAPVEQTI